MSVARDRRAAGYTKARPFGRQPIWRKSLWPDPLFRLAKNLARLVKNSPQFAFWKKKAFISCFHRRSEVDG